MNPRARKILLILLLACVAACITAVVAGCGGGHEHTFGEWVQTLAPTCEETGKEERVCSDCGEKETRNVKAKGHSYSAWNETEAASCEDDGSRYRTCSECGDEQSEVIPALGHDWNGWQAVTQSAEELGHGEYGSHYRTCKRPECDARQEEDCSYETETFNATCLEGGYHVHLCTVCSATIRHEDDGALGHDYSGGWTYSGYKTEGGTTKYYHSHSCRRCGNSEEEQCEDVAGDTVEKTCTTNGYTLFSCSECGHTSRQNEVAATGHKWSDVYTPDMYTATHSHSCETCGAKESLSCNRDIVNRKDPSCTEAGWITYKCSVCDRQHAKDISGFLGNSFGHNFTPWEHDVDEAGNNIHKHRCLRCSEEFSEPCEIVSIDDAATCIKPQNITETCKKCQYYKSETGEEALGHLYGEYFENYAEPGTHYQICSRCKDKHVEACNTIENITPPECETPGIKHIECTHCTYETEEEIEPLGHAWKTVTDDSGEHIDWEILEDTHKRECSVCSYVEVANHDFSLSNLCACSLDGLIYEQIDAAYVVKSGRHLTKAKNIVIPAMHEGSPVTGIAEAYYEKNMQAFLGMKNIETLTLPATLTYIGADAFSNCSNLRSVTVSGNEEDICLKSIGDNAFYGCDALRSVHIPKSVKNIGYRAFAYCRNLSDIQITIDENVDDNNIMDIGDHAFYETAFIKDNSHWKNGALYINRHLISVRSDYDGESFEVAENTITIGSQAFENCVNIKTLILHKTLKEVGKDAFIGCSGLDEVHFDGKFSDWIAIRFENDMASPMSHAKKLNISGAEDAISIPEGTTVIPAGTFKGSAITSVYIPATVTEIGEEAFENCRNLATITVHEDCKLIKVGPNAFSGTPYYAEKEHWDNGGLYIGYCLVAVDDSELPEEQIDVETGAMGVKFTVRSGTVSIAAEVFSKVTRITHLTVTSGVKYIGADAFTGSLTSVLSYAKFEQPNNWLCWSDLHGIGRSPKLSTTSEIIMAMHFYDGYWRNSSVV